jgi:uncharacterized OB-fold protein
MTRGHDIQISHHHCVDCGRLMTTAGHLCQRCDVRAQIEADVAAFKQRRKDEDDAEEEGRNARGKRWWN